MNNTEMQEKSLLKKILDKILYIITIGEYSEGKNNSEIAKNFFI